MIFKTCAIFKRINSVNRGCLLLAQIARFSIPCKAPVTQMQTVVYLEPWGYGIGAQCSAPIDGDQCPFQSLRVLTKIHDVHKPFSTVPNTPRPWQLFFAYWRAAHQNICKKREATSNQKIRDHLTTLLLFFQPHEILHFCGQWSQCLWPSINKKATWNVFSAKCQPPGESKVRRV